MSTAMRPWREVVQPEWVDYNGHLSEAYYVLVFGHATDAVMAAVGMTTDHLAATHTSLFTVEAHIRYLDQVPPAAELEVRSSVIGHTDKLLWTWHEMWVDGRLRATEEVLGVHVDTGSGRACPFPAGVADRVAALRAEPPAEASRQIRVG